MGPRQPRVALARGGRGRGLALLARPPAAVFELGVPARGGPAEGQRQERAQADRGKRRKTAMDVEEITALTSLRGRLSLVDIRT